MNLQPKKKIILS